MFGLLECPTRSNVQLMGMFSLELVLCLNICNFFHCWIDDYLKETAFTRRQVVFHETLASVKGLSERLSVTAGLCHEAVADRKAVEVTGAILKL